MDYEVEWNKFTGADVAATAVGQPRDSHVGGGGLDEEVVHMDNGTVLVCTAMYCGLDETDATVLGSGVVAVVNSATNSII